MPKKTLHLPALLLFGIHALHALLFYPLNKKVNSDVVLNETFLLEILNFCQPLVEWLALAIAIGFAIHFTYRYTLRRTIPFFGVAAGSFLFKYVISIVSESILGGSLNLSSSSKNLEHYLTMIPAFLLDVACVVFAAWLTHHLVAKLDHQNEVKEKACRQLKQDFEPEGETLPFTKLFCRKNPLLRATFWSTALLTALHLIAFLIDKIVYAVNFSYFFSDFLLDALGLITAVLLPAFLAYLTSRFCIKLAEEDRIRRLNEEAEEAEEDEDEETEEEHQTADEADKGNT